MYQQHTVTQLHRSGAEGRQAPHQGWGNRVISEDYFHLKTNIQFPDHSIQISLVPSLCLPKSTYVFLAYFSFSCPSFPYFIHCSFLEVWILMSISAHFITCYPTPFRSCLWQFGSFLLSVCPPRNSELHRTLQTCGSRGNRVTRKAACPSPLDPAVVGTRGSVPWAACQEMERHNALNAESLLH